MSEANNSSLKELIPKVGPRLRTLNVLKEEYGKHASIVTLQNARVDLESKILENPQKGQLKLNTCNGEWNLQKLNEKVCGNYYYYYYYDDDDSNYTLQSSLQHYVTELKRFYKN